MRIKKGFFLAIGVAVVVAMIAAALPNQAKVAKPEFVPGSKISIPLAFGKNAKLSLEATVVSVHRQARQLNAVVYVREDNMYSGPMAAPRAWNEAAQYKDAGVQVFVEGTKGYETALENIRQRVWTAIGTPALSPAQTALASREPPGKP